MIDYSKKFTLDREFYPFKQVDTSIESDRGRILSSPSFRRLQKRTQVFALELNASIRTRLTHSLEVGQTARSSPPFCEIFGGNLSVQLFSNTFI